MRGVQGPTHEMLNSTARSSVCTDIRNGITKNKMPSMACSEVESPADCGRCERRLPTMRRYRRGSDRQQK